MEVLFEKLIELFLTCDASGKVFLAPQYQIDRNPPPGKNPACPDAVLIDDSGGSRELIVVEITTASTARTVREKILNRQSLWFDTLLDRFGAETPIRVIVFVRGKLVRNCRKWATDNNIASSEVCFYAIEKAVFSWHYWKKRRATGLPR
jgi:hypothetical protein